MGIIVNLTLVWLVLFLALPTRIDGSTFRWSQFPWDDLTKCE